MKVCPNCNQRYQEDELNFCLNDGSVLRELNDDAPPTILADRARTTNPGGAWSTYQPPAPWHNQPDLAERPFQYPMSYQSTDQTLGTISLVLGILSFVTVCCYGGIPFGIAALVTGLFANGQISRDPGKYAGRGMAVAGMILGGVSAVFGILLILFAILGS